MSDQSRYIDRMLPWARRARDMTGLPVSVILSQWALETGWGRSYLATRHNSHAGIKWYPGTSIARGPAGTTGFHANFASYESLDQFLADYQRVLRLRWYAEVRAAAAAPAESVRARAHAVALALGRSPYSEDHYVRAGIQGQKLVDILDQWRLHELDTLPAAAVSPTAPAPRGGITIAGPPPAREVVDRPAPQTLAVVTPADAAAGLALVVAGLGVLAGLAVLRPAAPDADEGGH